MKQLEPIKNNYFTSFDGTKIFYNIAGTDKGKGTIIFLHGLGGNLRVWDTQLSYFQKKGYQTIAFDLRRHGLSDRPKNTKDYTIEKFAKDIITFFKIYPQKKVIIIGHCLGGIVALKIVKYIKIKPKAIILISTATDPLRSHRFLYKYFKFLRLAASIPIKFPLRIRQIKQISFEKFSGTNDFDPQRIISDIFHTTLSSYLATSSYATTINNTESLKYITCPTLIIHGAKDHIFPISAAHRLHDDIKYSKLIILPTANHIIPINNPKELTCNIDIFLNDLK
jgi:pimeloyl-ACP methyl ester carboxylesterase